VDVVAGAEIHIRRRIHKGGLNTELRIILSLTKVLQVLGSMVDRHARLETVLVIERYEVPRISQSRHREIAHSVIRVIGFVGTHEGRVALEAKARIADRVLPR